MRRRLVPAFLAATLALTSSAHAAGSISISPAGIAIPVETTRTFVATVSGLASTTVTWEVNGTPGGTAQTGMISGGVYVAPAAISTAPLSVTITARSVSTPSVTGSTTVSIRNRVPWLTTVSPAVLPSGGAFTVDVVGSRFVAGARVVLNNTPLTTTFLSSTNLRATGSIPSGQLGSLALRVDNPGPVPSTDYAVVAVPAGTSGGTDPLTLDAVRFLEQASFGPTTATVQSVVQTGIDAWITAQMDPAVTPPSVMPDGLSTSEVVSEWMRHMTGGQDQLRQRVMFALSQIFVVSRLKNTNGIELSPWVRLLSRNAFGNFRTLLQEVTLSPTMGKFLDLANSRKPAPGNVTSANENYARELMQLFTIGLYELEQNGLATLDANGETIDTYDQSVVRNMALAMTGWIYGTAPGQTPKLYNPEYFLAPMEAWDASHDKTQKTIFDGITIPAGLSAPAELKVVLDHLFLHDNVPPFFATRMIRALVTSNPSPEYVERVADVFVDNGAGVRGDIAAVVRAILTDDEARPATPAADDGRLKDPVLHVLGLVRALGGQAVDPSQVLYLFRNLGQEPLTPVSVFSFYSPLAPVPGRPDLYGPEFQIYTPALAIQRANLIWPIINGQLKTAYTIDLAGFVNAAADPVTLVNLVDARLFFGRMSPDLRQAILSDSYVQTDKTQRAMGALYIAAISSEYAVLR